MHNAKGVAVTQGFLSSVVAILHAQPEGKERLHEEGDSESKSKKFLMFIYTDLFPQWFTRKLRNSTALLRAISGSHTSC